MKTAEKSGVPWPAPPCYYFRPNLVRVYSSYSGSRCSRRQLDRSGSASTLDVCAVTRRSIWGFRAVAQIAFLFCCFVWGTSFILLERVTHAMGPVEIAIWRMFTGAAVVGVFWWLKRDQYRVSLRDFTLLAISSIVFTA